MQIYFIRHAQSENNALYARSGSYEGRSSDPGLSEIGRIQASLLAKFLSQGDPEAETDEHDAFNRKGFAITHLYCSLLRRSIETALEISETINVPAVAHEELHEWGGVFEIVGEEGDYVGLPGPNRSFFTDNYPALVLPDSLGEEGWWNRPHESREAAFERANRFLDQLFARHRHENDRIALVTHAGFYHSLLTLLTDLPIDLANERWMTKVLFAMNNAAITRVSVLEHGTILVYSNRADFLPPELIT